MSIRARQALDVLLEDPAAFLCQRNKFETVMEATPMPDDSPYLPGLGQPWKAKMQRDHFPHRNFCGRQHSYPRLGQVFAVRIQLVILISGKQGGHHRKLAAIPRISPSPTLGCCAGGL